MQQQNFQMKAEEAHHHHHQHLQQQPEQAESLQRFDGFYHSHGAALDHQFAPQQQITSCFSVEEDDDLFNERAAMLKEKELHGRGFGASADPQTSYPADL